MVKKRPEVVNGKTVKVKTECGNLYVTLNVDDGQLCEIRTELGKAGQCTNGLLKALAISWSIMLQELEPAKVMKLFKRHYKGLSCGSIFYEKGKKYTSCVDKIMELAFEELKEEASG